MRAITFSFKAEGHDTRQERIYLLARLVQLCKTAATPISHELTSATMRVCVQCSNIHLPIFPE